MKLSKKQEKVRHQRGEQAQNESVDTLLLHIARRRRERKPLCVMDVRVEWRREGMRENRMDD